MLVYQRVIFNSGVKMRVSEDLDGQAFRPEFFMTKWHHFLWGPNSSKTPEIRLAATCSNSVCWLLQSIFNTHHALFQIGYLFCPVLNEFLRCDVTTCVQIVQGFQKTWSWSRTSRQEIDPIAPFRLKWLGTNCQLPLTQRYFAKSLEVTPWPLPRDEACSHL